MPHIGSLTSVVEYALLMRIPLLTGVILVLLPWLVRLNGVRALLLGLFDITPASTIAVTLAATSVAGIVADNARVIYLHSYARGMGGLDHAPENVRWFVWAGLGVVMSLPVIVFAIRFSNKQNPGDLLARVSYALGTLVAELVLQQGFVIGFRWLADQIAWTKEAPKLLAGYLPWKDHVSAAAGFALALTVYIALGFYGKSRLGKRATVPALCSALMVLMLACSTLSALTFFLDLWHVPVLLVLIVWGLITAQSKNSDHFYQLLRRTNRTPAPTPIETLRATNQSLNGRIVVVAANGGGIQAAAWAAQVLAGLARDSAQFAPALRLISSVSGGSLGSACYTYKQAHPDDARDAFLAASDSSLDEVSWGLSWPDLVSSVVPWFTKGWIGRGRALELAWIANCGTEECPDSLLGKPLSDWNAGVWNGELPAVIMNATLVETGQRLLLGTTRFTENENCRARVDASEMHGAQNDVAAVTAARLSASFPYVTPASRSTANGLQPHVVDGGYYDNYGMSTLVEWLDEALSADLRADKQAVKSVLVIQIHGAPVSAGSEAKPGKLSDRGWFFQTIAPLLTLNHVRGAGQVAHNDLELGQLQQRWFGKVPIHSVTLEFPDEDAPLSWHLTQQQKECVLDRWVNCQKVQRGRRQVHEFLEGSDCIECACPTCKLFRPLERVVAV